jgi:hypothetical protein
MIPKVEDSATTSLLVAPNAAARQHAPVFNSPPRHSMVHPLPVTAPRRDTAAWRLQVWLSFGIAASLCAIGLAWLPGNDIDRAFMVMGYVYCVSSAFALSKFVRDNERARVDTPLWKAVVWGAFFAAMALTGWGLVRMTIQPVWQAYLLVSWLFLISSTFTLAKTLRDAHEADLFDARLAGRRDAAADAQRTAS